MAEQSLRVMIVDHIEARAAAVACALEVHGYIVAGRSVADDFLPTRVAELRPDVVLIHIDAPNRDTLEQIDNVNRKCPLPIVMFTQNDDSDMITRAVRAGVSAYVVDGLHVSRVRAVIDVAIAQFQAFKEVRAKLVETQSQLTKQNDVELAKSILMTEQHLTEDQAHRLLQQRSMNQKRRLADVASEYVRAHGRKDRPAK